MRPAVPRGVGAGLCPGCGRYARTERSPGRAAAFLARSPDGIATRNEPGRAGAHLRHTYRRRWRVAGVSFEDRQDGLGCRSGWITTHYCAPERARLLEGANRISERDPQRPERVVLRPMNERGGSPAKIPARFKRGLLRKANCLNLVARVGIEPTTRGFSVRCSTN